MIVKETFRQGRRKAEIFYEGELNGADVTRLHMLAPCILTVSRVHRQKL